MIAIIYNDSIKSLFYKYAELLKEEFDHLDTESSIISSSNVYSLNGNYDFNKAIFFDKDIVLGQLLENNNIRLYNPIESIRICDDKRLTYLKLSKNFKCPKTIFFPLYFNYNKSLINDHLLYIEKSFEFPFIAKLAFGSLGNEVTLIRSHTELELFIDNNYNKPMLFSEYIDECPGKDVRVYVVGSRVIASMLRYNPDDFRSNIALSGIGTKYTLDKETEDMCIKITHDLKLDFCGIDLLFKDGKPSVICEVNSNAMFEGINKACNVKIENYIAKYILNI